MEITFLYSKKRIATSVGEIRRRLLATSNSVVYPLDEQVVALVPTGLEIHDAIIVATALVYRDVLRQDANVITKDRAIKDSGLVEVLW